MFFSNRGGKVILLAKDVQQNLEDQSLYLDNINQMSPSQYKVLLFCNQCPNINNKKRNTLQDYESHTVIQPPTSLVFGFMFQKSQLCDQQRQSFFQFITQNLKCKFKTLHSKIFFLHFSTVTQKQVNKSIDPILHFHKMLCNIKCLVTQSLIDTKFLVTTCDNLSKFYHIMLQTTNVHTTIIRVANASKYSLIGEPIQVPICNVLSPSNHSHTEN